MVKTEEESAPPSPSSPAAPVKEGAKKAAAKKKTGLRKNPSAPKRFKSSYILFFIHVQKQIKETLPEGCASAPEVAKKASEMWKALSAAERDHWDREADKEKKRYMSEKAAYTGQWQVPHKRAKKDPTAPKRNPSAFLLYSQAKRKVLKANNPDMKNTEISRVLGEMWRNTTDEEKRPHLEREYKEREKYKEDMLRWREQQEKKKQEIKIKQEEMGARRDEETEEEEENWSRDQNIFAPSGQDAYAHYFSRTESDGWHTPPDMASRSPPPQPQPPRQAYPSEAQQDVMSYMSPSQSAPTYAQAHPSQHHHHQHHYHNPHHSPPQYMAHMTHASYDDNNGLYRPQCQNPGMAPHHGHPPHHHQHHEHHHDPNHDHPKYGSMMPSTTTSTAMTYHSSPPNESSGAPYYRNASQDSASISSRQCETPEIPSYACNNADFEPVSFKNCESFDSIRDDFEPVPIN